MYFVSFTFFYCSKNLKYKIIQNTHQEELLLFHVVSLSVQGYTEYKEYVGYTLKNQVFVMGTIYGHYQTNNLKEKCTTHEEPLLGTVLMNV